MIPLHTISNIIKLFARNLNSLIHINNFTMEFTYFKSLTPAFLMN